MQVDSVQRPSIQAASGSAGQDVLILMGTYNGARYLAEQLDSIEAQTHSDWRIVVSDDGSSDETASILTRFAGRHPQGRVQLLRGPGRGFLLNYLSLACSLEERAAYYAFCDQDDVWDAVHLQHALEALQQAPPARHSACLYGARTRLIDQDGYPLGHSPMMHFQPSFQNALVQSYAGANTMVFNRAALELLQRAGVPENTVASHDWWLYLLVSGAGGRVLYDEQATVEYRQHGRNVQGQNRSLSARLMRLFWLLNGRMRSWNCAHVLELQRCKSLLDEGPRETLQRFSEAVHGRGLRALQAFRASGVSRRSSLETALLAGLAFLGRL